MNSFGMPIRGKNYAGQGGTDSHPNQGQLDRVSTEKWNPVTFAICSGNLALVKHLVNKSSCNLKQLIKVPGIDTSGDITKLFPFYISMYRNSVDMFKYFWEELGGALWNENSFDSLFKLLAKRDLAKFLPSIFKSQTTLNIFYGMSY
jgi:hypothetical protein